jgi:hypothetical protein
MLVYWEPLNKGFGQRKNQSGADKTLQQLLCFGAVDLASLC